MVNAMVNLPLMGTAGMRCFRLIWIMTALWSRMNLNLSVLSLLSFFFFMDNPFFTCFSRNPFILLHPPIVEFHPTNVTIPDFYSKHCSTICMSLSVLPTILQLAVISLALDLVHLLVLTVMMEIASPAVLVLCFAMLYPPAPCSSMDGMAL